MKPPAMVRALERAARVRWEAGAEQRRLDIRRMYTETREQREDHDEAMADMQAQQFRQQLELQMMVWKAMFPS